ncbi:phosphate:acyl-[acyl carrier protein] acyltransferase [Caloramator fervidus]|uniref:Phosphate acyltransferase n=1 Tax=Caloramator fervidus TaxID=29344 RepID=A0A1H5TYK1_9CLOT|nr:phosphate acyltransferase PlsX [Caloramator fervidus]SEF67097.1 phosphate:acyl-[acyl carrier protein] acyltransferase [Caloramator fervidus]
MKIVIDAMGGDNAPEEIIKGAIMAVNEFGVDIILVGDEVKIKSEVEKYQIKDKNKVTIVHASEIITNDESPTMAIRRKKHSSMVVGLKMLKEGYADAFISAGSTGALLAGGLFIVGRIDGIDRPCLAPIIPGEKGNFMLLDAGANAECKPRNILQFAIMGDVYSKKVLGKQNPKVGLVNIGVEEEKGTEFVKQSYALLKQSELNFIGNIEPRDIPKGECDIVLADGFVGNVILKLYEGVAQTIFDVLKREIYSSFLNKLGGFLLKPVFKKFKTDFDYTEYGGAILLGVKNVLIKAHGSSNAKAIKNAVKQAVNCINGNVVEIISQEIKNMNILE